MFELKSCYDCLGHRQKRDDIRFLIAQVSVINFAIPVISNFKRNYAIGLGSKLP